jgi:hypothetical protein
MATGELMATVLGAAWLATQGLAVEWLDARSVLRAGGHAEAPLSWDDLVGKFRDAAGRGLDAGALQRNAHVFQNAHVREYGRDLKRAHQA